MRNFQVTQKVKKFETTIVVSLQEKTLVVRIGNAEKSFKLSNEELEQMEARLIEYGTKQLISDAHAGAKQLISHEALKDKLLGKRVYSERTSKIAKIKELKAQFQQGKLSQEDFFKALSELGI